MMTIIIIIITLVILVVLISLMITSKVPAAMGPMTGCD